MKPGDTSYRFILLWRTYYARFADLARSFVVEKEYANARDCCEWTFHAAHIASDKPSAYVEQHALGGGGVRRTKHTGLKNIA